MWSAVVVIAVLMIMEVAVIELAKTLGDPESLTRFWRRLLVPGDGDGNAG